MYHGKNEKKKKKMVYGGTASKNMMGGGRVMYAHGSMVNAMPKAKPC